MTYQKLLVGLLPNSLSLSNPSFYALCFILQCFNASMHASMHASMLPASFSLPYHLLNHIPLSHSVPPPFHVLYFPLYHFCLLAPLSVRLMSADLFLLTPPLHVILRHTRYFFSSNPFTVLDFALYIFFCATLHILICE